MALHRTTVYSAANSRILPGVLPLEGFRLSRNMLEFDDLAVKFGLSGRTSYKYTWFRFDNRTGRRSPAAGGTTPPHQATVFFPRDGESITTVGIDRS